MREAGVIGGGSAMTGTHGTGTQGASQWREGVVCGWTRYMHALRMHAPLLLCSLSLPALLLAFLPCPHPAASCALHTFLPLPPILQATATWVSASRSPSQAHASTRQRTA
jgi:hypothetical protein